jgi:hypothetical protein
MMTVNSRYMASALSSCVALGGVLLTLACGGKKSGDENAIAICSPFTPCGGDLVGEWEAVGTCVFERTFGIDPRCPEATFTYLSVDVDGELHFDADGTIRRSEELDGAARMVLPLACVEESTCEALATAIQADAPMGPRPLRTLARSRGATCARRQGMGRPHR